METNSPTPPRIPSGKLKLYYNSIRIEESLLFALITDCVKAKKETHDDAGNVVVSQVMEKMHLKQIVALKMKFMDNRFLARSDFKQVVAIMRRYKDEVCKVTPSLTDKLEKALLEASEIEAEAEYLMSTVVRVTNSNFEVMVRDVAKA